MIKIVVVGCRRFIPTRVGNTRSPCPSPGRAAVHPHARGEHPEAMQKTLSESGSSPRAWGTRVRRSAARLTRWFIPTRVGNTSRQRDPVRIFSVHPHARGEHRTLMCRRCTQCGSSPRAWGTQLQNGQQFRDLRFIPTRVGNTKRRVLSLFSCAVHPHARGEHRAFSSCSICQGGSSPRAWGTHLRRERGISDDRFIPTRVGNTSPQQALRSCSSVHPHARGEHLWMG